LELPLSLFALFFTIAMTLGMKKFDRYLLLCIHWSICWQDWASLWLRMAFCAALAGVDRKYGMALLLGAALVVQTIPVVDTYPYYLTYYNPLMGGSPKHWTSCRSAGVRDWMRQLAT
jgi:hypothetical protein